MSYKGNHFVVTDAAHYNETLKDFLVACGWQLIGPTDTEVHRIAQDDKHAHVLGWFLQSNGEDGLQDLQIHLHTAVNNNSRYASADYSWLTGGITDVQVDNIPVQDSSKFASGSVVRIGTEMIQVGSVATGYLNGCSRGFNGTTPGAHDDGDVVLELYGPTSNITRPYLAMYAFRDLVNSIAESSGTIGWTLGTTNNADAMTGLDGYTANTFRYLTYIRPKTGAAAGIMRAVRSDSAGLLTWDQFKTAPGPVHAEIVSMGWFGCHSKAQQLGSSSYYRTGTMHYGPTYGGAHHIWLYGSKDGFAVVVLDAGVYYTYYFGSYVPYASPLTTAINKVGGGDIPAGIQTVVVSDTGLFAVGGKYRILAQDYRDWVDNQDRSADTFMGASPGNWRNFYADETAFEPVVVDSINEIDSTITFTRPVLYSYRAGAVIGEDPRHIVCTANGETTNNLYPFKLNEFALGTPFHTTPKSRMFADRPCHRRKDLMHDYDSTWSPWNMDGGFDTLVALSVVTTLLANESMYMDNEEWWAEKLVLAPFTLVGGSPSYDRSNNNVYGHYVGVIPFVRAMYSSLGAANEDTVRAPWAGKQEVFRVFYDTPAARWLCLGPEIWP